MAAFEELADFLKSNRHDLKAETLKVLLHTIDSSNVAQIAEHVVIFPEIIKSLEQPPLIEHAANVLTTIVVEGGHISSPEIIMNLLLRPLEMRDPLHAVNSSLILLTNLTISDENSLLLAHMLVEKPSTINAIMNSFLEYNTQIEEELTDFSFCDPWQHWAGVLCNLTRDSMIRSILLKRDYNYVSELSKQVALFLFFRLIHGISLDSFS
jgi:hypothetical protein